MTLEEPFAVITTLFLTAIVMWILAQRSRHRGLTIIGAVLGAMAGGVWLVSAAATTPRERLIQRAQQLIEATTPPDIDALSSLLEPNIALSIAGQQRPRPRDKIQSKLKQTVRRYGIVAHDVAQLDAVVDRSGQGRSFFSLRTTVAPEITSRPVRTTWVIHWRLGPDDLWRIMQIDWIGFENHGPPAVQWRDLGP